MLESELIEVEVDAELLEKAQSYLGDEMTVEHAIQLFLERMAAVGGIPFVHDDQVVDCSNE